MNNKTILLSILVGLVSTFASFASVGQQNHPPRLGLHELKQPKIDGSCETGFVLSRWVDLEHKAIQTCVKCGPGFFVGPISALGPAGWGIEPFTHYRCIKCDDGFTIGEYKGKTGYMYWRCVKN